MTIFELEARHLSDAEEIKKAIKGKAESTDQFRILEESTAELYFNLVKLTTYWIIHSDISRSLAVN